MRHRTSMKLALIFLALAAAGPLLAFDGLKLEGSLSDPTSVSVLRRTTSITLPVGSGRVTVSTGALRALTDRREASTALELDGLRLEPAARYLLVADSTPLLGFSADAAGRVSARYLAGSPRPGWRSLPPVVAGRLQAARGTLRVVQIAGQDPAAGPRGAAKDGDGGYFDWTMLCSADGGRWGETSVSEYEGYSYFSAFGSGLEPGVAVTLRADGIEVGTVQADEWGYVWIDADAGEPPWLPGPIGLAALFDLPDALLPVSGIEAVELLVGGTAVLAGNFASPCMEEPPMPVDAGSIELCDLDGSWSSGWFDWALFDSGLEVANVYAYGLEPGTTVEVSVDGTIIGSGPVLDDGSLWLALSSDPQQGELPLPPEVLPLADTQEVVLASDGVILLSGTPDTACAWPGPVEMATTPLCFTDPGDPATGGPSGEVGWAVHADGTEELWLWASGLEPATDYGLTVDGNLLGSFPTDEWGSLWLGFSSNASSGQLPLPEPVRPVSGIDQVALDQAGTVVGSGSFSEPCIPPEPPPPVEYGWTSLCPPEAGIAGGDVTWMVYDSGDEQLLFGAYGLEPGSEVQLMVDGHNLGAYPVDEWGGLYLEFASNPAGDWQLTLPAAIRPVSGIDQVSLLVGGGTVLEGSFSDPCGPSPPPVPIDSDSTLLCPQGDVPSSGDVIWAAWDDGSEELYISAYFLAADTGYELVVDGFSLGTFTADSWGYLSAAFASTPQWDGQLLLPQEIQPVSEIDVVELRDAGGNAVAAGSFSSPCTETVVIGGSSTGLCGGDGVIYGMASWWTASLGDITVAEGIDILLRSPDSSTGYHAVIDGIEVGDLEPRPWEGSLMLSLGTYAEAPVPPELEPVEGIDIVQVLTADGAVAYQGSFAEPCMPDGGDLGPLAMPRDVSTRAPVR